MGIQIAYFIRNKVVTESNLGEVKMNKALFLAQTAMLLCLFSHLGGVNHMDMIQTMSEYKSSRFGNYSESMGINADSYEHEAGIKFKVTKLSATKRGIK